MTTSQQPKWHDSGQGDLLELVAQGSPSLPTADEEWELYQQSLVLAADRAGIVRPNLLRPLLRGHVSPRRVGAFANRALSQRIVEYTGDWEISNDTDGRNAGKPARIMRLIGGDSDV